MQLVRPLPPLHQRERDWHLRRKKKFAAPAAERTLVQTNSPGKERTERTRQIEQISCMQFEPKSKFCAAWYFSPFLNFRYALPAGTSVMSPTAAMETASKARPPARGKASDIATVIKPTERPRARSWLKARSRRPMQPRPSPPS